MMGQEIFSGIDHGFAWTDDWYEWDAKAGNAAALKARNARLKELRKQGKNPRGFTLGNQLVSRGGVGSGHPHIEEFTKCYGINY